MTIAFVLVHGGLSKGKEPALLPSADPHQPVIVQMEPEEAARINGPAEKLLLPGSRDKGPCLVPLDEYEAQLEADAARASVLARVKARGMSVPESFEDLDTQMRTVEAQFTARDGQLQKEMVALQKLSAESQERIAKAHEELEKKWKELDARQAALDAQAKKLEESSKSAEKKPESKEEKSPKHDEKPKGGAK